VSEVFPVNRYFLEKADLNTPKLYEKEVLTDTVVEILPDASAFWGVRVQTLGKNRSVFKTGDSFVLDFGEHCVGTLSFRMRHDTRYLDAPVRLKLRFGEIPYEIARDPASFHGSLSVSWLQEEIVNLDFPGVIELPRRYCFRYLEVTVIWTPRDVRLEDFSVRCVTSADLSKLEPLPEGTDPELVQIDRVAAKTLADCMQTAYEDGPKRDRRLWSGDLRLQALTDYYLYKNDRLARRCLYLFAACEEEGAYLPGCLYQKPSVFYDNGMGITDYAMLFAVSLCDYYEHTGDKETTAELYPVAMRQMNLACSLLNEEGVITFLGGWFAFIDWAPGLRHTVPVEGVVLYAMEKMAHLAAQFGDTENADKWNTLLAKTRRDAYFRFYDKASSSFRSEKYDGGQYSVQAQVWMILGGVTDGEEGRNVLLKALGSDDCIQPVTPYMHHYVVEAMIRLGMKEEALAYIKSYWGSMIRNGADTFWEAYNPALPELSPYNDPILNSFCHAWSCSPSYFIRKFFL